jgi:hypothetical protein
MATNLSASAKIYTFPPRGRFAAPAEHEAPRHANGAFQSAIMQSLKVASGSGWYHEEAIEAERRRKN